MSIDYGAATKQTAFLGCFSTNGNEIQPLESSNKALLPRAKDTCAIWAAVSKVVDEFDMLVIRQGGKSSICLPRGGLIIEAKGDLNLGLLRWMVRSIELGEKLEFNADPLICRETRTLFNLARWFDRMETGRMIELKAGREIFKIWSSKGLFDMVEGGEPAVMVNAIRRAIETDKTVCMRYCSSDGYITNSAKQPMSLFGEVTTDNRWIFEPDARNTKIPAYAQLDDLGAVLKLREAFDVWRGDIPAELTAMSPKGTAIMTASADENNVTILDVKEKTS